MKCFQIGKENENIKVYFNLYKDVCMFIVLMFDQFVRDKLICIVEIFLMVDVDKYVFLILNFDLKIYLFNSCMNN